MGLLQIFAGLAVLFLLPGYTLVCLLFPRKGELDPEYDIVYRVALGMGLSIVIAIFVGFALNAISTEEQGYVTPGPLWASLLTLTGLFFVGGWFMGAYPWLGLAHPKLYRPTRPRKVAGMRLISPVKGREVERLLIERDELLRDIEKYASRASTSNPNKQLYYRKRIEQAKARVEQLNDQLERLEGGS
ncbi:MAG: DUF1616 domain-containing protein [Thermoplasmata archaeon]